MKIRIECFILLNFLNEYFHVEHQGRAVIAQAGAASPYSSDSIKMLRLLEAPAPQRWLQQLAAHIFAPFESEKNDNPDTSFLGKRNHTALRFLGTETPSLDETGSFTL
jgi:hypothetical protein